MSKSIKLTMSQWTTLHNRLKIDYNPSVLLIRNKMKSVLGFTNREHVEPIKQTVNVKDVRYSTIYRETYMHLDFYNEPKRTMFLLKYGEYVSADTFDRMD